MRLKLVKQSTTFDFFGRWKIWLGISTVMMGLAFASFILLGLNFGIDFRGGTTIRTESTQPVNIGIYRDAMTPLELGDISITEVFDPTFDFDQNVAFININDLESLFNLKNENRYLEIFLKNPYEIIKSKKKISNIFKNHIIYSWADLNKSLFSALKVERNVMLIILSLIVIVAAFNIISGLTILVKNKTREIAILKSLGVQNLSIKKIFFMVGFLIGSVSTIFGVIIGVFFSLYLENIRKFVSKTFDLVLFPDDIYFLEKIPTQIDLYSIIIIIISSIIITSIVSLYPASKAAKLNTSRALKYE